MQSKMVRTGLECFLENAPASIGGSRLGLVMNQASIDGDYRLSCDWIDQKYPGQLRCLFSPQHGLWGEQQANMIETAHSVYPPLDIPVFSLYSETRSPHPRMLDLVDCLLIDLQDVGTRVYTFVWSMLEILRACAHGRKKVVVLDRPNPLGGIVMEGPELDPQFTSFVGGASIPMRHACTMAELAQYLNAEFDLGVDLNCVRMEGWQRPMLMKDTGLPWLWPSPNMPTLTTTLVYPGQVMLEGVNLSEGRGTTRPFEVVGAPYVDSRRWLKALENFPLDGVRLVPTQFQPTFDKWSGVSCHGVDIQIIDPLAFRSFTMTIALIATAAKLFPGFRFLDPPYEYETVKMPIDILFGSDRFRIAVESFALGKLNETELLAALSSDFIQWKKRIQPHLLY